MEIQTTAVSCVGDLIAEVVKLGQRWSPAWFRGQADAQWHLEPKLHRNLRRLGVTDPAYETNLTHRFRGRAKLYGPPIPWEGHGAWLQTMQHHRLPTRLLDWSRSPLVAAYFAVENALTGGTGMEPVDVAVWALNPHALNDAVSEGEARFTPGIEAQSARALIDGAFFGDEWARKSARVREEEWKEKAVDVGYRTKLPKIATADCLAVMANESDLRMFVQQGAFTVHGFKLPALDCDNRFIPYLHKYLIGAEYLVGFAREIETCGFSEAAIYPDLDNLSRELERTQEAVGGRIAAD